MGREGDGTWKPLPSNCEGSTRERWLPLLGDSLDAKLPVAGVTVADAEAYCAWRSRTSGGRWRLPSREEREKASRGVDGRTFPWGETADPALARSRESRAEQEQPEPVNCFPTATSVYGMRDAAGNSFDWTSTWADPARTQRITKGGSWLSAMHLLRCAVDHPRPADRRFGFVGFRVVREIS
jgi:formylglycine-generating enzyme required for sulfatase activity